MARPRRKTRDNLNEKQSTLAKALDFVKIAQVDDKADTTHKSHCRLASGYAVAFDGILTVGHPIEEDFNLCPNTYRLISALKLCKHGLSITELDGDKLVIKSGSLRAVIPCMNHAAIPFSAPDARICEVSNTIKEGFALLNPFISRSGDRIVEYSLLLQDNVMVSTDMNVMVEFWHGIRLPNRLVIPKQAVTAIARIELPPMGIGLSDRTATFLYEGGAWLKTQLYDQEWPDYARILDSGDPNKASPIPPALFEAIDAVSSFNNDRKTKSKVFTLDGKIGSHNDDAQGVTYEVDGIRQGLCFLAESLSSIKALATSIDLEGVNNATYFYGDRLRGAIAQSRG